MNAVTGEARGRQQNTASTAMGWKQQDLFVLLWSLYLPLGTNVYLKMNLARKLPGQQ